MLQEWPIREVDRLPAHQGMLENDPKYEHEIGRVIPRGNARRDGTQPTLRSCVRSNRTLEPPPYSAAVRPPPSRLRSTGLRENRVADQKEKGPAPSGTGPSRARLRCRTDYSSAATARASS